MEKTFLLGMGAQKSGTTWLHRILTARQDANFGFTKEYHVLDAVYVPECEMFRNRFEKAARIAIRDGYGTYSTGSSKYDVTRMSFIANDQTYFAYFADIHSAARQAHGGHYADLLFSAAGPAALCGIRICQTRYRDPSDVPDA